MYLQRDTVKVTGFQSTLIIHSNTFHEVFMDFCTSCVISSSYCSIYTHSFPDAELCTFTTNSKLMSNNFSHIDEIQI